jgi:predicted nucleotidyltransferase
MTIAFKKGDLVMCTKTVLDEITTSIAAEAKRILGDKLDKVILYGSYARGDFNGESDIDIMVLANIAAEETWKINEKIIELSSELGYENNVLVSPFVKDCATFYKYVNALPFYKNVMKEGVELIV